MRGKAEKPSSPRASVLRGWVGERNGKKQLFQTMMYNTKETKQDAMIERQVGPNAAWVCELR